MLYVAEKNDTIAGKTTIVCHTSSSVDVLQNDVKLTKREFLDTSRRNRQLLHYMLNSMIDTVSCSKMQCFLSVEIN